MPQLELWDNLPGGVRHHLIERMRDRAVSISDLNQLRLWIETRPEVPQGDWYKEFGVALVTQGSFPDVGGNVVVEGLNSLYQEDLDRYLRGENVPEYLLQRRWRDTTQVFASPVMLTACEQFINEIRKVNLRLP